MKFAGKMMFSLVLVAVLAPAADRVQDLDAIRDEQKLEKRARLAVEYARKTVGRVVKAYRGDNPEQGATLLGEIQEAVELAKESLDATGKIPHKRPKHFKRAEIGTRRLLRDLEEIEKDISYDEREKLQSVRERIEEINRELLMGIMTKKKE